MDNRDNQDKKNTFSLTKDVTIGDSSQGTPISQDDIDELDRVDDNRIEGGGLYTDDTMVYEPNFIMADSPSDDGNEISSEDGSQEAYTEADLYSEVSSSDQDHTTVIGNPPIDQTSYSDNSWSNTDSSFVDTSDAGYVSKSNYNAYNDANLSNDEKQYCDSTMGGQESEYSNGASQGPSQTGAYYDPRDSFAPKNKKGKRKSKPANLTNKGLVWLIIVVMLVSMVCGAGGSLLAVNLMGGSTGSSTKGSGGVSSNGSYTLEDATGSKMTVAEVVEETEDSVVSITTEGVTSDSWLRQYVTEGAGSGVIISSDGYIITNHHVVEDANKITVTTSNDQEYEAQVIGSDEENDIAVIKINAKGLNAVTYGNSDQLSVGDMAVVIGNPLGELSGTVTQGIISDTDRELEMDGVTMTLIQTDASINPGNSGGGLFNGDGQLVGIVCAKSSGSEVDNIGFAIPINIAADVAEQIMDKGYVSGQIDLGITLTEQSYSNNSYGGIYSSDPYGDYYNDSSSTYVFVSEVTGDNAKDAGFKTGDLIYSVDGNIVSSESEVKSAASSKEPGDKLKFVVVRDDQTVNITLELDEQTE